MNRSEEADHAESYLLQQRNNHNNNNNTSSYQNALQRGLRSPYQDKNTPNHEMNSVFSDGSPSSSNPNNRSWRAPFIMLSSLLAGLVLAIAHHEMNQSLNMKIVDTLGSGASQEWTSRYATALAFLIQMAFGICVGTAFIQRQWLNFTTRRQAVKVNDFDKITSVLGDIFSFFSKLWLKSPLLAVLALTAWSIPLASVFTPGSLTIQQMPRNSIASQTVPQLAFENYLAFVDSAIPFSKFSDSALPIQTTKVTKLAWATAIGGQVLPMTPLHVNQSYAFSFFGPSLQCNAAPDEVVGYERDQFYNPKYTGDANNPFLYHSWTSHKYSRLPNSVVLNSSIHITQDSAPIDLGYDTDRGRPELGASINVASIMGIQNKMKINNQTPQVDPNITVCRLHNATYKTQVDFLDNIQTTTTSIDYLNPVPGIYFNKTAGNQFDPGWSYNGIRSYSGIMSAFGGMLVGFAKVYANNTAADGFTPYQYGAVTTHFDLLDIDWTRSEAMASGLEQLFTNITLSLLSDSTLLDTTTAPQPITVTIWSSTYTYNQLQLLLPYGLALLVSFVSFLIGMHAFYISKTSYQNKFSSFVRASIGTGIEEHISDADTGSDPSPKALAEKVITMGKR